MICEAAPHAVVFADEAYFHFHGETSMDDVPAVANLVVGRTFSKAYGLANLRVGNAGRECGADAVRSQGELAV